MSLQIYANKWSYICLIRTHLHSFSPPSKQNLYIYARSGSVFQVWSCQSHTKSALACSSSWLHDLYKTSLSKLKGQYRNDTFLPWGQVPKKLQVTWCCTKLITKLRDNWDWKGPEEVCNSTTSSQQVHLLGQTSSLGALLMWVLESSEEGHCITSLGNLFPCLPIFNVTKFFYRRSRTFLSSTFACFSQLTSLFCKRLTTSSQWRYCRHWQPVECLVPWSLF